MTVRFICGLNWNFLFFLWQQMLVPAQIHARSPLLVPILPQRWIYKLSKTKLTAWPRSLVLDVPTHGWTYVDATHGASGIRLLVGFVMKTMTTWYLSWLPPPPPPPPRHIIIIIFIIIIIIIISIIIISIIIISISISISSMSASLNVGFQVPGQLLLVWWWPKVWL